MLRVKEQLVNTGPACLVEHPPSSSLLDLFFSAVTGLREGLLLVRGASPSRYHSCFTFTTTVLHSFKAGLGIAEEAGGIMQLRFGSTLLALLGLWNMCT